MIILLIVAGVLLTCNMLCIILPSTRSDFFNLYSKLWDDIVSIALDAAPSKQKDWRWWEIVLCYPVLFLGSVLLILLHIIMTPFICLRKILMGAEKKCVPDETSRNSQINNPIDKEEERKRLSEWMKKREAVRFYVDKGQLLFTPDTNEVFFYTPYQCRELESLISKHLRKIRNLLSKRNLSFVFLPNFNSKTNPFLCLKSCKYYNPRIIDSPSAPFENLLSYDDLKSYLSIPDKVNSPCLIRCKGEGPKEYVFSFFKLECQDYKGLIEQIKNYIDNVGDNALYSLQSEEEFRKSLEGKEAIDRFEDDIYLIGKEIRGLVEKLRSKGLSELAIRKLVGDSSSEPSHLRINKQNRIFLTDYGDKEIKLSPVHKAVFFLFLRHPEGIYFKELPNYQDELRKIYSGLSTREDKSVIEDSVKKLTDLYDNSINEKCARIKNAFVSEFREEIAKWYFIDGPRGGVKKISLPRELLTWEH